MTLSIKNCQQSIKIWIDCGGGPRLNFCRDPSVDETVCAMLLMQITAVVLCYAAGILAKAEGLAILTVVKVGFLVTARAGSGIVIARLGHRSQSSVVVHITRWHFKNWTISFRWLQRVCHTCTKISTTYSTVPKTLIKMLLNMSTLCCNNGSQSFPKLSDCPRTQICPTLTCLSIYLWHHKWCHKEHLTQTVLQRILILYHLRILSLASTVRCTTMKPLLSSSLCKLCSQTATWSTFFCATL